MGLDRGKVGVYDGERRDGEEQLLREDWLFLKQGDMILRIHDGGLHDLQCYRGCERGSWSN